MTGRRISINQKGIQYAVIILLFIVLWLPLIQMVFPLFPERKLVENRILAPKPNILKFNFGEPVFQKEFEKYFNDHFGFRNILIFLNNYIKVAQFNTSPNPQIAIGKEGWLFYDDSLTPFKDHMGLVRFEEVQLAGLAHNLETIRQELDHKRRTFLVVIAPSKETIYPEYLPDTIKKYGAKTKTDQFIEYLRAHQSKVPVLDLRAALWEVKKTVPCTIYFKTDSHWNEFGAFLAFQKIMDRLSRGYPNLKPVDLSDFGVDSLRVNGLGDIVKMLSMDHLFEDTAVLFTPKDKPTMTNFTPEDPSRAGGETVGSLVDNSSGPRILMYHDSFGNHLRPFLSPYFSRSAFIWSYSMDRGLIEKENPDIVILEVTERYLDSRLPNNLMLHW